MRSITLAGLLAAAVPLMAGDAAAQDTRSAIEKALGATPSKTMIFSVPVGERLLGETWRQGVFAILEARLARAKGGKHAPRAAALTCLDIDDRGHVVSAVTCRSSGDAEADKLAVTAATRGGDFPPPPGERMSGKLIKLMWMHQF